MRKYVSILALFGLSLCVFCASGPPEVTSQPPEAVKSKPYLLGPRDVVHITVSNHPELSGDVPIDSDGKIELPLTEDVMPAAGLTIPELEDRIREAVRMYIKMEPRVKIKIAEYESKMVYVVGEIASPGKYPLQEYIVRVRDIVFEAGLPTKNADLNKVYIIKPDLTDPSHQVINLRDIIYKGILRENYRLEPGDILYIRPTVFSLINKHLDDLLNPATKAAALFYLYTQWVNIIDNVK